MKFEIGEVCEFRTRDQRWRECTVMAIGYDGTRWYYDNGLSTDYTIETFEGLIVACAESGLRKKNPPEEQQEDAAFTRFKKTLKYKQPEEVL